MSLDDLDNGVLITEEDLERAIVDIIKTEQGYKIIRKKKEGQPKKIDVVKEMDRIERRESLEEGRKAK